MSKVTAVTNEHTDWHTDINQPWQQIGRYDTKWDGDVLL